MDAHPNTFVIAEAGVNHNGSLDLALELVSAAKASGADAVKFQTFDAATLVTRSAAKAAYQRTATVGDDSQYAMLEALELELDDWQRIHAHCQGIGIEFLSSPFDERAVDVLDELGVRTFKVPSGEITNLPFLEHLGSKRKPVILSTGMAWLGEVETAARALRRAGSSDLTLLHCVSEYPAPVEQINLRAMLTLAAAFGLPVGYSDHTAGIEIPIAAVALGAAVIEKHFTLDTRMPGPDHSASLDPRTFTMMVSAIRNVELALGDGRKQPAPCELLNRQLVRKSIVAVRDLHAGETLRRSDLSVKRPGSGIPPSELERVIGRRAARDITADTLVDWQDLA